MTVLRSVYTQRDRDREREDGFSSWNSLVICRRTVQIECEREHFFFRANDRLDYPQSEFCQKFARHFCYLPISKYFSCIISTNRNVYVWLFQENLGTSVSLVFLVKFREEWTTHWARQNQWLLKLRRIMDCKTKQIICTHCAYEYITMIIFVSNYTCTIIPNDQIWYLKQVKDEPPCNPSTVFRIRALFKWQNRSKVAVAVRFVFSSNKSFLKTHNMAWTIHITELCSVMFGVHAQFASKVAQGIAIMFMFLVCMQSHCLKIGRFYIKSVVHHRSCLNCNFYFKFFKNSTIIFENYKMLSEWF